NQIVPTSAAPRVTCKAKASCAPRPGRPALQRDLVSLSFNHPSSATRRERGVAAVSLARRGAVTVSGEGWGLPRSGPFPAAPERPPAAEVTALARAARGGGVRDGGGAAPPSRAGRETQLRAAPWRRRAVRRGSFSPRYHGAGVLSYFPGPQPRPRSYRAGAGPRGRWGRARPGQDGAVVWGVGQRVINVVLRGVLGSANGRLCCVLLSRLDSLRKRELTCHCFGSFQRLKAAVHYTVGCLCQEVAENKEVQFSKQTIAAIAEITFRQCENFAKDLEMFARHAKRSTVTTEDVKLLARRSNSLLKYITQKSDELISSNMEQKEKKKKKSSAAKGGRTSGEQVIVTESEDSNMA
uniref:Centromere protein S n=1 Tax=Accipiter nisus TaxID=211598 RepID=A0A8B9MRM5_9AVES